MVDDSKIAISANLDNSILITSWDGNMNDKELYELQDTLKKINEEENLQRGIKAYTQGEYYQKTFQKTADFLRKDYAKM